jgi:hypothetical protein
MPARATPPKNLDAEIDQFERELNRLRIDFERFLNGALEIPPVELESSLVSQLHRLRARAKTSLEIFRLGALEGKLQSQREHYQRRLRDKEMGGLRPAPRVAKPALDAGQGVELRDKVDDAAATALYRALYGGLAANAHTVPPAMEKFRETLARQVASVREKTGCASVRLRVVEEDGRPKLKARPIHVDG